MSGRREGEHPEDPAEGSEDAVSAPGADRPKERREEEDGPDPEGAARHPGEPAEGGEDDVDAPGADKPGD